ncbi:MAG: diaminopimelate decarboxylase [bacterium]|nr:diaminopimelate decarboxylase [bacterium]
MSIEYNKGKLFCGRLNIETITRDIGTPLYLYDYQQIVDNLQSYINAFKEIDPLICCAYKANSNLSICKLLTLLGCGADVVSGGEIFRALKVGVLPEQIIFNGNAKTKEELEYAISNDIFMINVDCKDELYLINQIAHNFNKKIRISIRVNPHINPITHPYIATGLAKSKFGMDINAALDIYKEASMLENIIILGVHAHIGSQITSVGLLTENLKKLVNLTNDLAENDIKIKYINVGGGLGIKYHKEEIPQVEEIAKTFIPIIKKAGVKLILEPGRSIIGNAGIIVTKVLHTKETSKKKFIVVDAAMNDLVRPAIYGSYHRVIPLSYKGEDIEEVDIVGGICESGDFIAKKRNMPRLFKGDYLAVLDTGAYGFSMSSNYNSRRRLPEILVKDEEYYIIRHRENYEDLIAKEEILDDEVLQSL